MPIYEYIPRHAKTGCPYCQNGFEEFQSVSASVISNCPKCGESVKKTVSRCYAAIIELSEQYTATENQIRQHEQEGRWSHAAELSDKQAADTSDSSMKARALDNYHKAGYNTSDLSS